MIATDWIQAVCSIITVIFGGVGLCIAYKQLPKISKEISNISKKMIRKKPGTCDNCPFASVCYSPYVEETGDFDKINEIENQSISDGIIALYDAIKSYPFDRTDSPIGSKDQQECLLRKLTLAVKLIGSANMAFNIVKDERETGGTQG
jgi:hypothetical protein